VAEKWQDAPTPSLRGEIMHVPARVFRFNAALYKSFSIALLFADLFFCSATLNATSVVALIDTTNHRLVIAADCRVRRELVSVSDCKIISEPGCTVAIAGLYEEKTTQFKLRELVRAACRAPGDLRAKADAFLQVAKAHYERAVRHIREADPSDFGRTMENKPTEVFFAGLQGEHLALFVRGLISDAKGKVTTEQYESTDTVNSSIGYFAGLNGYIRAYIKTHPNWVKADHAKLAHEFVEMEIEAHPDLGGLPISELEIDKDGHVHWLDKGVCNIRESD
jgi:hypothetical protein